MAADDTKLPYFIKFKFLHFIATNNLFCKKIIENYYLKYLVIMELPIITP